MSPRILVTGAGGFLGSAIVRRLRAEGRPVWCTDIAPRPPAGVQEYVSADLTDPSAAEGLVRGADAVVHAAGMAHQYRLSHDAVASLFTVNVGATEHLVRAAVAAGVGHFVLISSVSVYGDHDGVPDEDAACRPPDAYAKSKYEGERVAICCAEQSSMRLTILRMATAFGEEDPGNVARLMRWIDSGRFVWIGRGDNRKTLVYRDDAADAAVLAVERRRGDGVAIYNICPPPCTMREVVAGLASALQRRLPRWHVPGALAKRGTGLASWLTGNRGRLGALRARVRKWLEEDVFDGSRARETLGFAPQTPLAEGLRREVVWYRGLGDVAGVAQQHVGRESRSR